MSDKSKFNWGWKITLLYSSFVIFILSLVAFASFQSFDLVEKDYYSKELAYQRQIDKTARTNANPASISVIKNDNAGLLELAFDMTPGLPAGSIHLFRPSDRRLDYKTEIAPDGNGHQVIQTADMRKGLWRIKIDWSSGGNEYYYEDMLILE